MAASIRGIPCPRHREILVPLRPLSAALGMVASVQASLGRLGRGPHRRVYPAECGKARRGSPSRPGGKRNCREVVPDSSILDSRRIALSTFAGIGGDRILLADEPVAIDVDLVLPLAPPSTRNGGSGSSTQRGWRSRGSSEGGRWPRAVDLMDSPGPALRPIRESKNGLEGAWGRRTAPFGGGAVLRGRAGLGPRSARRPGRGVAPSNPRPKNWGAQRRVRQLPECHETAICSSVASLPPHRAHSL